MIPPDRLLLLDTNVLLHLVRGGAASAWIEREYAIGSRPDKPLISIVSVGELYRIAQRGKNPWGERKREQLRLLLAELVVIELEPEVIRRYGEIGAYLDDTGQPVQQNDVWIAATAASKRAVLLTTDSDFDRLHPTQVEREYIDPARLPRPGM
jgi:tRNA(fMet)-specific endonuclease VapC